MRLRRHVGWWRAGSRAAAHPISRPTLMNPRFENVLAGCFTMPGRHASQYSMPAAAVSPGQPLTPTAASTASEPIAVIAGINKQGEDHGRTRALSLNGSAE